MPVRYTVSGASKETGKAYTETICAADASEAERMVARRGVAVSDVAAVQPRDRGPAPRYHLMAALAGIMTFIGVVTMIVSVIVAMVVVFSSVKIDLVLLMNVGGACASGLVTAAIGQAIGALRDIAINSFDRA